MNNNFNVIENDYCPLPDELLSAVKIIKSQNKSLPFIIEGNGIRFDEYIIGNLQVGNCLINILPRHDFISTRKIFEMLLYISGVTSTLTSDGFEFSSNDGISVIPQLFISSCESLVREGLSGGYHSKREVSDIIRGTIAYDEFQKNKILIDGGITCDYDLFSLDILQNRIIKAALRKSLTLGVGEKPDKIFHLLTYFDEVSDTLTATEYVNKEIFVFHSLNNFYNECLKYALIILNDVKLSYDGNAENEWNSFLINSNTLFEDFIRKVLSNTINERIEKWTEPRPFATIEYSNTIEEKSFIPDIVINYNENNSCATAVFDVKNKSYKPKIGELSGLVSSPDLYQILFYCNQLNCKIGGVIYPADVDNEVIKVNVSNKSDNSIYLLSVNMSDSNINIEKKLKNHILKILSRT